MYILYIMSINEVKDFVITNYPFWKVKSLYRSGIDLVIDDGGYVSINDKILDYELFYDFFIEIRIVNTINNDIVKHFDKKVTQKQREFIIDYVCGCIPSFKRKVYGNKTRPIISLN